MKSLGSLATESISLDQLKIYQLEKLKNILAIAYQNVSFYKKSFDDASFNPSFIKSLEDLNKVPMLTKKDLQENPIQSFLAVPKNQILRWHCSSGTTGQPVLSGYTSHDLDVWRAIMARALSSAGVRADDILINTHGYGLFTGGLGVHYGAEKLGCTIIPTSTGRTSLQVQLLKQMQATVLVGTPSYMLRIAHEIERQKINVNRDLNLRICICGAEPWSEARRREIEQRLNVVAFDLYGLTEVMGPGVASEHADQKGSLVVWEDHFYPEIIDGQLVITTLTREGMPIVRFKTGDITEFCNSSPFAFRSIRRIQSRTDEMIKIRGVSFYPSQIEELLSSHSQFSGFYKIVLSTVDHLDQVCVYIESDFSQNFALDLERIFWAKIGIKIKVNLCAPGSLESNRSKVTRLQDLRSFEK